MTAFGLKWTLISADLSARFREKRPIERDLIGQYLYVQV